MNYIKKLNPGNLKNPLKTQLVNFIWGIDGWCYIPELKIRQKYTETKYFMEEWNGIIPMPCHHEKIEWSLYSQKPRIWKEGNDVFYII